MIFDTLRSKARNLYTRTAYRSLFRQPIKMCNSQPLISFSFDDFPCSAYEIGGAILQSHGFRGTYYASLGLMGTEAPVGKIFAEADLSKLLADGHELGCHTFGHCDAWSTTPGAFERSIVENKRRLNELSLEASFKTHSYPKSGPRPHTKRRGARHFACCRFGGQTYNAGIADRCLLSAYFLEQGKHDPDSIKKTMDRNSDAGGWLIFATHDVCEASSRFGCSPRFFEDVVRYASRSGATVVPVSEAWEIVCGRTLAPGVKP